MGKNKKQNDEQWRRLAARIRAYVSLTMIKPIEEGVGGDLFAMTVAMIMLSKHYGVDKKVLLEGTVEILNDDWDEIPCACEFLAEGIGTEQEKRPDILAALVEGLLKGALLGGNPASGGPVTPADPPKEGDQVAPINEPTYKTRVVDPKSPWKRDE